MPGHSTQCSSLLGIEAKTVQWSIKLVSTEIKFLSESSSNQLWEVKNSWEISKFEWGSQRTYISPTLKLFLPVAQLGVMTNSTPNLGSFVTVRNQWCICVQESNTSEKGRWEFSYCHNCCTLNLWLLGKEIIMYLVNSALCMFPRVTFQLDSKTTVCLPWRKFMPCHCFLKCINHNHSNQPHQCATFSNPQSSYVCWWYSTTLLHPQGWNKKT